MNKTHHTPYISKLLLLIPVLALSASCVFIPYDITEPLETPIEERPMKDFKPGKFKRSDIIEWFGPPDAIARPGTTIKVPSTEFRKMGSSDVDSQTFFELFPDHQPITRQHIIYYYETSAAHGVGAIVGVIGGGGGSGPVTPVRLRINKLWILIDTASGYAIDYKFSTTREVRE